MARRPERDMQSEADVNISKVSDSGYSTGRSNGHSNSQRSGSTKSTRSHSGSSTISSSYGVCGPAGEPFPLPPECKVRDAKQKKKKQAASPQGKEEATTAEVENMIISESGEKGDCSVLQATSSDIKDQLSPSQNFQAASKISGATTAAAILEEVIHEDKTPKQAEPIIKPEFIENLGLESTIRPNDHEFFLVLSLHDGKIVYAAPTITNVLGFPMDMWLGRSFVDFIHHKDRDAFDNHITADASRNAIFVNTTVGREANNWTNVSLPDSGIAIPQSSISSNAIANFKPAKSTFFCCIRKYRGLRNSGFGVKGKEAQYMPFQLSLSFKGANGSSSDVFLIINASAVKTAYNRPEESFLTPQFSTRQLANCAFSYVDAEAVSYLGYLPQDIVGKPIFDFYHTEDIHLIKEMFEKVLEYQGESFRSKPYRFRTQNGGYVILETEWSAFVNPWSRKLEFTIGQHSVLRGPANPDVFAKPQKEIALSEEVVEECKKLQEDIKYLMNQTCPNRSLESTKEQVSNRCQILANFIKNLMDEITQPRGDQSENKRGVTNTESSESVLLGEISPHHNARSAASSETPPSYRQLNYTENIQRFFESKPKTTQGSGDDSSEVKVSSNEDEDAEKSGVSKVPGCDGSRISCCEYGLSKQSHLMSVPSTSSSSCRSKHFETLTKAVLCRHNEDMEKIMLKKHKQLRTKDVKGNEEVRIKKAVEKLQDLNGHGVKRSGSASWEAERILKHRHVDPEKDDPRIDIMNPSNTHLFTDIHCPGDQSYGDQSYQMAQNNLTNFNLWSQQLSAPQSAQNSSNGIQIAGMIPISYIPTDSGNTAGHLGEDIPASEHPGPPRTVNHSFLPPPNPMPGMSAFTMFGAPSMLYLPMMLTPQSQQPMSNNTVNFQLPASYDKSAQKEPIGCTMSECMKKGEAMEDIAEDSPSLSQDENKSRDMSGLSGDTGTGDESSYSSSFSSLLRTEGSWRCSPENELGRPNWGTRPAIKKKPPWLEDIEMTPDLALRYQINTPELSTVLAADLAALSKLNQPSVVDDQLEQLYVDLENAGLSTKFKLGSDLSESSGSSSENSSGDEASQRFMFLERRTKKRNYNYGQLVMVYEENMPLPPASPLTLIS